MAKKALKYVVVVEDVHIQCSILYVLRLWKFYMYYGFKNAVTGDKTYHYIELCMHILENIFKNTLF